MFMVINEAVLNCSVALNHIFIGLLWCVVVFWSGCAVNIYVTFFFSKNLYFGGVHFTCLIWLNI